MAATSAQVCACHDVSEQRIVEALPLCTGTPAERLQQLQQQLRCGTECGSCLPAVKALVQRHAHAALWAVASPSQQAPRLSASGVAGKPVNAAPRH
jgi:assimilatory nitrate reductase catalytic subunit